MLVSQFFQLFLSNNGQNQGNVGLEWDVDCYCVLLRHEDVKDTVKEVLPFLGLNEGSFTLNFISIPSTLSLPEA